MSYHLVKDYYRQKHYDFFSQYKYPFYGITVELDIQYLQAFCRQFQYSLNTNLCYLCVKAMSGIEDFRFRIYDDDIVLYDKLHFRMLVPNKDQPYTVVRLFFDEDIGAFNKKAAEAIEHAYEHFSLEEEKAHLNFVYFSALPKVAFTSLTHLPEDNATDTVPKITFGKFRKEGEKVLLPIGLQVNHRFIDGEHLSALVENMQYLYNNPADELPQG